MNVEDRLRATTEAVTESMRPVRPLVLPTEGAPAQPRPGSRPRLGRRLRPGSRRDWSGWLIPLTAAAAVIIVAATLVTVKSVSSPAGQGSGPSRVTTPAAANQVPAYYAAIAGATTAGPYDVTVGATATGKSLFTIKPPKATSFGGVSAAADDRTFVVSLWRYIDGGRGSLMTTGWELLRVNPGTAGYTLHKLPIPAPSQVSSVEGFALSPDGTKLAVLLSSGSTPTSGGGLILRVYSVATGRVLRSWQQPASSVISAGVLDPYLRPNNNVAWLADGHELAFSYNPAGLSTKGTGAGYPLTATKYIAVRRLDLDKPGTSLIGASSPVVTIDGWADGDCTFPYPAPDGKGALCGSSSMAPVLPQGATGCKTVSPLVGFYEYSRAAPRRPLYTIPVAKPRKSACDTVAAEVLWSNPSASTMVGVIVTSVLPGQDGGGSNNWVFGVLAHGRWTPLPIRTNPAANPAIAF